jgi:hypothetical protein
MTRPYDSAAPALAGETPAVGLSDPASETLSGNGGADSPQRTDWQVTTVADLTAAGELLDCLEVRGFEERELIILGNSTFAVRWR